MKSIIDVLPEPVLLLDKSGVVLHANRAGLSLLNRSTLPIEGTRLASMVAESESSIEALLRQGFRSAQFSPGRLTACGPDGQTTVLRCDMARVEPAEGGALLLLRLKTHTAAESRFLALNERIDALSREVGRRQAAEHALRTQSGWLSAVLRSIGDAVIATDQTGRVVFMNVVAESLCGWSTAEASGQPVASVFTIVQGETRAVVPCPVAKALREQRIVGVGPDTWLLRRDGQAFPIDDAAGPIVDELEGTVLGAVLVFREISQRLQAEADRHDFEQKMREAQRMEAMGTLAGGIAHDFNNVLSAILGNAMLATDDLDPAHPAVQKLAQIHRAGRRARELVRQIMAFSRRQPKRLVCHQVQPLVEECVNMLRSTLPSSVRLTATICERPLYVMADATQVSQVLMNLCTNAWHALRGTSGTVEITLDVLDGDPPEGMAPGFDQWERGQYARISVADNGSGIEPHLLPRIFEPFFTTKEAGVGTGLGLSVAHGIVAEHQGALAVRSRPGQGTCFDLLLPLVPVAASSAEPAKDMLPARTVHRSASVMYVDDDEMVVLTTSALLQRAGHRVITFGDGQAALAYLRTRPDAVDVLVTDYNMPGLDGLSLAREARHTRPSLPVILTSGYLSEELSQGADALGGVQLLNKEESFEQLPSLIEQVLSWV